MGREDHRRAREGEGLGMESWREGGRESGERERVEGAIGRDGRVCATAGRRRERGDCLEEERRRVVGPTGAKSPFHSAVNGGRMENATECHGRNES